MRAALAPAFYGSRALYLSVSMRRNSRVIALIWTRYVATSWSPQRSPAVGWKPRIRRITWGVAVQQLPFLVVKRAQPMQGLAEVDRKVLTVAEGIRVPDSDRGQIGRLGRWWARLKAARKQQAELEFAEPGELEVEAERVQVAEFERQKLVSHSAHVAERFAISRKALICASVSSSARALHCRGGYNVVVDLDLEKFFDRVKRTLVFLLYQKGRDPASFRLKTARSTISKKSMLAKIKARKAVITVQVRRKGFRCRLMNSSVSARRHRSRCPGQHLIGSSLSEIS
jgi:hypothetical protein